MKKKEVKTFWRKPFYELFQLFKKKLIFQDKISIRISLNWWIVLVNSCNFCFLTPHPPQSTLSLLQAILFCFFKGVSDGSEILVAGITCTVSMLLYMYRGLRFTLQSPHCFHELFPACNFLDSIHKMVTTLQAHQGAVKNLLGKCNWIKVLDYNIFALDRFSSIFFHTGVDNIVFSGFYNHICSMEHSK